MTKEEKMTEFINENYPNPYIHWNVKLFKRAISYFLITDDRGCSKIEIYFDGYPPFFSTNGFGLDTYGVFNAFKIMNNSDEIIEHYKSLLAEND